MYRFLDKLAKELKEQVEKISFRYTQKILNGELSAVFYDMTILYFKASDEDDRTPFIFYPCSQDVFIALRLKLADIVLTQQTRIGHHHRLVQAKALDHPFQEGDQGMPFKDTALKGFVADGITTQPH